MTDTIKIGNLDISSFKVGGADCSIYLGDTKLYPQISPTPSYTLLQGIERKAGYLGYIDLGVTVRTDFKIEITHKYTKVAGGRFFGIDNTFRWFKANTNVYFDYNGSRIHRSAGNYYPTNSAYTVTLANYKMSSSLYTTSTNGTRQTSYTPSGNLCLFSSNISSNGDLGVFYSVRVFTNNGNTLIGDFIPVKRNSDNLVTMFNTVTNTFCEAYGSLYPIEISS